MTGKSPASDDVDEQEVDEQETAADEPEVQETVEVTVPGALVYRDLVTRATSQVCRRLQDLGRLETDEFMQEAVSAIGEAFNNVVLRSYDKGPLGYVTLIFHVCAESLDITMLDYGVGAEVDSDPRYEPLNNPSSATTSRFIIQAFMDEVEQHLGRPNRLHMRKYLR